MNLITPAEARQILKATGISQRKAAEMAGVSSTYYSEWINNHRILDTENMVAMTHYFERVKAIV